MCHKETRNSIIQGFRPGLTQTSLCSYRSLKFVIKGEQEFNYPNSKNKSADQLCSYCAVDLRLCFCIGKIRFSHNTDQLILNLLCINSWKKISLENNQNITCIFRLWKRDVGNRSHHPLCLSPFQELQCRHAGGIC